MLDKVKLALRIKNSAFDPELQLLIDAAMLDLGIAGVEPEVNDALVQRAVITYVKANFGEPVNYDRLAKIYDEQKAQLRMATGYTNWGD